jgi:hypothetical protein
MDISILEYIIIGAVVVLITWIAIIEYRLKKFFVGTKAHNLEGVLLEVGKQIAEIKNNQIKTAKHLSVVDERLDKSVRKIETVRFNPFPDAGSNQSFAMAFLSDEGDGVIMSSLYARDRMSIFAKPVKKGKSEFELSAEEKEVLNKAK